MVINDDNDFTIVKMIIATLEMSMAIVVQTLTLVMTATVRMATTMMTTFVMVTFVVMM